MGAIALGAACLLAAIAAALATGALPELRGHARGAGATRGTARRRARDEVVALAELVGHWAPFVRLCNRPALRALGERLVPVLGERGVGLSRLGSLALACLACLAAALLGALASRSLLGAPVGVVACVLGIGALLGARERRGRSEVAAQMPEVLRSLASALSAGKSLPQAVAHVGASVAEPLGSEFLRASFEIEGGRSVDDALGDLCGRIDAPGIELLGTALQVSQRTGSSLGELFARTARMVAASVALRRELMVKTSQARLSARVVTLMPLLLVGILTLISPDYRAGVATAAGGTCLCVAALLDLTALGAVRLLLKRSLR